MAIVYTNRVDAPRHALAGRPFKASALWGTHNSYQFETSYHAGRADSNRYDRARGADLVDYVIHSYKAPIAWCDIWGTWHAIDVQASRTTSIHRNAMHRELVRKLTTAEETFWLMFDSGDVATKEDAIALHASAAILARG